MDSKNQIVLASLLLSAWGVSATEVNGDGIRVVGPGYFEAAPHELLDFSTDGDGEPVTDSGVFDMLVEYAPLGLQFDNAAFFGLQWRLTKEVPYLQGGVLGAVSAPVLADSFGMTAVAFDEPLVATGITIVVEDIDADLYLSVGTESILIDDSMIVATEIHGASTYHAMFLGIESEKPFSSVQFGYPQGGTVLIDDLRYVLAALPCPSDLNNDRVVDAADLGLMISHFGLVGSTFDINGDGVIDAADLGLLIAAFGTDCP